MLPTKKHRFRRRIITLGIVILFAGILLFSGLRHSNGTVTNDNEVQSSAPNLDIVETATSTVVRKEVILASGDTLDTVLASSGVPYEERVSILESLKSVYDVAKMQAGKAIHIVFTEDALASVDYDLDASTKIVVEKNGEAFESRTEEIPYVTEESFAEGRIVSSLFTDGDAAGLTPKTILELADVFASDIDFSTDITEGDSFSVVFEKRFVDGEAIGTGRILAARFENRGQSYEAYYYKKSDGSDGYFDEKGVAKARQFLRSPINVGYISSGFSYKRENPVTKQVTPHRAIDYAAPEGTPVIATASGEVVIARSKGDLGITVELEHGEYLSQYAHLVSINKAVTADGYVEQGEVVGYVGSTGISTGPHLQYALFKNGTPINPASLDLPVGESLESTEKETFTTSIGNLSARIKKP